MIPRGEALFKHLYVFLIILPLNEYIIMDQTTSQILCDFKHFILPAITSIFYLLFTSTNLHVGSKGYKRNI
jgi:hypothetical protein